MAQRANFVIDQGADFSTSIIITNANDTPINLSTFVGTSQIRKYFSSNTYYTLNVNTFSNGTLSFAMAANATANIPAGRYVYDCLIESNGGVNGTISRIVQGIVTVMPQVTK